MKKKRLKNVGIFNIYSKGENKILYSKKIN